MRENIIFVAEPLVGTVALVSDAGTPVYLIISCTADSCGGRRSTIPDLSSAFLLIVSVLFLILLFLWFRHAKGERLLQSWKEYWTGYFGPHRLQRTLAF